MRPFAYAQPATVDEAIALAAATPDGGDEPRFLAGGTDLLTLMKGGIAAPERLVDIKRLADLDDAIELTAEGLRIGALATLSELQDDPLVAASHPALAEAAASAATPQLRNMATIGGNLLQRPRCWYFRDEGVDCWLKGGETCTAVEGENRFHALFGDSPCRAVHPSDLATALVTLDASVQVRGGEGERTVRLEEFFALPTDERRRENTLRPGELIVAVTIPSPAATARSVYLKAMDRQVWTFALVSAGAMLAVEEGRIAGVRLVLGGVAPIPWRVPGAEAMLLGAAPERELFEAAAERAIAGAAPLAHNGYKIPLARTLVRRALEAASIPQPVDA